MKRKDRLKGKSALERASELSNRDSKSFKKSADALRKLLKTGIHRKAYK